MKNIKPLSPKEVSEQFNNSIPDEVIQAVNTLLIKEYTNGTAILKQKDIIAEIRLINSDLTAAKIYENGWLDFENVFISNGWEVEYDKPVYCEDYDAFFRFRKKNE